MVKSVIYRTMKRHWTLLLIAATVLLSCTSEQVPVTRNHEFMFSSQSPVSKTSWNLEEGVGIVWTEGDMVGLWGESASTSLGLNCEYKAIPDQSNNSQCTFKPVNEVVKYIDDSEISIYGYYPFIEGQSDAGALEISIPSIQSQTAGTDNLSKTAVFKADPMIVKTSELDGQDVNLTFRSVFPVLELSVTLTDSDIDVPLKEIRFSSASGAALAYPEATLDLKSRDIKITPVTQSSEIILSLDSNGKLKNDLAAKFYIVMAPGQVASDDIKVELVAIDHSTASVNLSGDIEINAGKVYRKNISVKLADFIPANPFSIMQNSVSATAGQTVHFDFNGEASTISLYTGMEGCDYNHINSDRYVRAETMKLSFSMRGDPSGSANAFNPAGAKIALSTDFDGRTLTESGLTSAQWTDITDRFTLPTEIKTDTPAGEIDIIPYFPADKDYIYLRYHYAFNKGTNEIGRTIVYVKEFKISSFHTDFGESIDYNMVNTPWLTILPADNPASSKVDISETSLKFNAGSWKPAADGQAWVVAKIDVRKYNVGKDKPLELKTSSDQMPQGVDIIYDKPGNYEAVFVVRTDTLFGLKEDIIVVPVTVE